MAVRTTNMGNLSVHTGMQSLESEIKPFLFYVLEWQK